MKKVSLLVILCSFMLFVQPALGVPKITGKGAVLLDMQSGQVLYEQDKDEKLPPASTTKILTAIMAIESGKLDETVTIGPNPPQVEGTRVYLEEGERISLRQLVQAALIHSANDAALAIAEYLGGTETEFARMMNEKAGSIGAVNSHFVNPHGLSAEGHYTTAGDLALIGCYAMQNEVFREIVQSKVLDWEGQAWQTRLININKLLWQYDGANGVKTGYTTEAKNTIVASATRDNRAYLAVVLGSSSQAIWEEAGTLLDYGFDNYQQLELAQAGIVAATVSLDKDHQLQLMPRESFFLSIPQQGSQQIQSQVILKPIKSDVAMGQVMGEMVFTQDGNELGRVELLANNEVNLPVRYTNIIIYTGAGLFFLQVLWRTYRLYAGRRRSRRNSYRVGSYYRT